MVSWRPFSSSQDYDDIIWCMEIPHLPILLATLVQFLLGALWYSPLLFGKVWMEIMECANLSKEELQKMQKEMTPFYVLQFLLTLIFTSILAFDLYYAQVASLGLSPYVIAGGIWFGFIVPTQISGVVWANTKKKYWLKQILIMTSYQLVGILSAAYILSV